MDSNLVYGFANAPNKPYNNEKHYLIMNIAMGGNLGGGLPGSFSEDIFEIGCVRV